MVRKFLRGLNILFLLLIIISTFCSCTNEMNMLGWNKNEQINFSVSVPEWKNIDSLSSLKTSRATPITDASLNTSNTFNLIADQNDGAGNYSTLINSQAVTCTNNLWKTSSDYYWSGTANKTINFYAYYPTSIFNLIPHSSAGSTPAFSYTIPDNVANQIDIITATSTNVPGNTVVPTSLTFKHIFAAIQFSVGSAGIGSGTISSISIGNVANSGTYTFGSGWSNVIGSKTFTISQSKTITGTSGEDIYSGTYTLMMIPQAINNVTITITYSNGGTLTKVISGLWEAGNIYNYEVSYSPRDFDYTGSMQMYTIPISGIYKFEVWGAGSNGANSSGGISDMGLGGYALGIKYITSGTKLYIYIGGVGKTNNGLTGGAGGYNGGGNGEIGTSYAGGSGGGGATHISTTDRGMLNNYSSYKNEILIVAGGSGGSAIHGYAGTGGGLNGGSATTFGWSSGGVASITINGGTQNSGYLFGKGQDGDTKSQGGMYGAEGNGGGGGGWYGGFSYTGSGDGSCCSGSGGSGYIGGVSDGSMQNGVRSGNGYARITFVSAN